MEANRIRLKEASQRRAAKLPDTLDLEEVLYEKALDALLLSAKTTGPEARHKLKGLLKHYAKKTHPFRACVRDNMKRFGPGRTEAICATLKDIIRGTTKWRGHKDKDKGSKGLKGLSEETFEIDDELAVLLSEITDDQIEKAEKIMLGGE